MQYRKAIIVVKDLRFELNKDGSQVQALQKKENLVFNFFANETALASDQTFPAVEASLPEITNLYSSIGDKSTMNNWPPAVKIEITHLNDTIGSTYLTHE